MRSISVKNYVRHIGATAVLNEGQFVSLFIGQFIKKSVPYIRNNAADVDFQLR